jgi:hypothetical protein
MIRFLSNQILFFNLKYNSHWSRYHEAIRTRSVIVTEICNGKALSVFQEFYREWPPLPTPRFAPYKLHLYCAQSHVLAAWNFTEQVRMLVEGTSEKQLAHTEIQIMPALEFGIPFALISYLQPFFCLFVGSLCASGWTKSLSWRMLEVLHIRRCSMGVRIKNFIVK